MFEWEERRNLRTTECLVNTPFSMFLFHFHTTQHRWCPLWSMPSSMTSRKRPFLFWTMLSWSSDAFCQAAELHSLLLLIHVNSQRKEESGTERERECINMCFVCEDRHKIHIVLPSPASSVSRIVQECHYWMLGSPLCLLPWCSSHLWDILDAQMPPPLAHLSHSDTHKCNTKVC